MKNLPAAGTVSARHPLCNIVGKLCHVGVAEDHRAVPPEIADDRRVRPGDVVFQRQASGGGMQAFDVNVVFDQDRNAPKREVFVIACIKGSGLISRGRIKLRDAVQPVLPPISAARLNAFSV